MHKNTIWYQTLLDAEKTCMKADPIKKIHYKFSDGREMVEEYNVNTQVLVRRAWKNKSKIGTEGKWDVEVGDPIPEVTSNIENCITECKDQPSITRRNTRINLEWRIRNLPYPIETYAITVDNNDNVIIVSTSNKKYFKKLTVPELSRLNLPLEQNCLTVSHAFHTLIIVYKKPQQLLDMEKDWYKELNLVKPMTDIPNECKTS